MNCPKCKNPIEEISAICKWCGANIENSTTENYSQNSTQENDYDSEIIALLKQKQKAKAVKLHQAITGERLLNSIDYVSLLDFFADAPEVVRQKYFQKKNKHTAARKRYIWIWVLFVLNIVFLAFAFSYAIVLIVNQYYRWSDSYSFFKRIIESAADVDTVMCFIIALFFVFPIIKLKKRINRIIL